jgi:hypothetical protein
VIGTGLRGTPVDARELVAVADRLEAEVDRLRTLIDKTERAGHYAEAQTFVGELRGVETAVRLVLRVLDGAER